MADDRFKNDEEMILVSSEKGIENLDVESMLNNNKDDTGQPEKTQTLQEILGIPDFSSKKKKKNKKKKKKKEPLKFVFITENDEEYQFILKDLTKSIGNCCSVTLIAVGSEIIKINIFEDINFHFSLKDGKDNVLPLTTDLQKIQCPSIEKMQDGRYKLKFNIYI